MHKTTEKAEYNARSPVMWCSHFDTDDVTAVCAPVVVRWFKEYIFLEVLDITDLSKKPKETMVAIALEILSHFGGYPEEVRSCDSVAKFLVVV